MIFVLLADQCVQIFEFVFTAKSAGVLDVISHDPRFKRQMHSAERVNVAVAVIHARTICAALFLWHKDDLAVFVFDINRRGTNAAFLEDLQFSQTGFRHYGVID